MDEALVSDLLAIIRRFPEGTANLLAARIGGSRPSRGELEELVRRARFYAADDEELGLSLAALLASARKNPP